MGGIRYVCVVLSLGLFLARSLKMFSRCYLVFSVIRRRDDELSRISEDGLALVDLRRMGHGVEALDDEDDVDVSMIIQYSSYAYLQILIAVKHLTTESQYCRKNKPSPPSTLKHGTCSRTITSKRLHWPSFQPSHLKHRRPQVPKQVYR